MKKETDKNNIIDIEVAERKYLKKKISKQIKILILISPFIFLLILFLFITDNNNSLVFQGDKEKITIKDDGRILGHYPYEEVSKENLIQVNSDILVHKKMFKSLINMQKDAEKEGIYLVFLSGYRSIKLQKEIFYSLKSIRNQNAFERAKVSAPPGYSEHSTGFAIDIGDALNRQADFEVEFENTNAFKWLIRNAAKYHFKLSFDKNHKSVDYEPWHWRYEGSIEALKIFEASNKNSKKL